MALQFPITRNPNPASSDQIAQIHAQPGFGEFFTDHMASITWRKNSGWGEAKIVPYGPLALDPAAAVLHYAQEIFEGLKAYRHADGSIWLFRPEMNAARFQRSAARMMLPELPIADFVESCVQLVATDAAWVPSAAAGEFSLYLRPFMFASETFLGVRAAETVTYLVIASPVGPYFGGEVRPVDIWVTDRYSRAGVGGTGAAKCGGNYASSLIAQYEGYEHGCAQVLFIEASGKDRLEELGGMNVFLITADGRLLTPQTTGTILEGVTRDSVLTVGAELGLRVEERTIHPSELFTGIADGTIIEAFSCGTAAVITPIGAFKNVDGEYRLPAVEADGKSATMAIRDAILDIQYGRVADRHHWMHRVV